LKNSGTGHVLIFNLNSDTYFNVYNSGTGDISIEGSAQSPNLKNEGSGKFEGFQFMVDTCDIKIEGSGDVHYLGTPTIEAN